MTEPHPFDDLGHRRCRRCGAVKPLPEFPAALRPSGTVKFGSYCRPCQKEYQHEWYVAHRDKALAAAAARRASDRARAPIAMTPARRRPLRDAVGFGPHANPRLQGNAGLGVAIAYLTRMGVQVSIPLTDTQRYDLIIEHDGRLDRVQVKTTTARDARSGHYRVTVQCIGRNNSGTVRRKFDPGDYEWLFVVCGDACCYMIPTGAITARTVFLLTRRYDAFMLTDESG